ncbi:iron transporter [Ephemerocybe angulata]|uniref:Solute carrier family 40 member n=1 Tax=Ephemerocybe angulata TaxID=980116 RepID=A0A8H6M1J6_9AGAR|nr:iron transporter [Tulosesus angulatus]
MTSLSSSPGGQDDSKHPEVDVTDLGAQGSTSLEAGHTLDSPVDGTASGRPPGRSTLAVQGLLSLCSLRFSSAWGERSSAFAVYLFLVIIFPQTLVPASAFGFCTTASGILFSSWAGGLVDRYKRLVVVRYATGVQKLATSSMYGLLLLLFKMESARRRGSAGLVLAMGAIVVFGCAEKVSSVCLAVSVEREWPSVISDGSSDKLTVMNTWLRRTDLICDLLSPLFVSALAAGVSYPFAAAFLTGMTVFCFALEIFLSGLVLGHFPQLETREIAHDAPDSDAQPTSDIPLAQNDGARRTLLQSFFSALEIFHSAIRIFAKDLIEFSKLPVFFTSLSIASIYLTVLSFDGTMLTYLKNTLNYSDPFLAGQRAACTFAGLLGTVLFPFVLRRIGLVRTGSWSIWFELACLLPVVVSIHLATTLSTPYANKESLFSPSNHVLPPWLAAALFGGMALSRIGLWMFDLAQLQILQESLEAHPRRNRLTSIQFTLQNIFDMAKYALTMGLAKPSQFRWAGLVSVIAVLVGGLLYVFGYARRVRGHIAPHWKWLAKLKII